MLAAQREPEVRNLLATAVASNPPGVASVLSQLNGAHVGQNSGESEWFTPKEYIDSAMGLWAQRRRPERQPAIANEVVGAASFYTAEQDGLSQPWAGRVWMNPPYSQPLVWQFCATSAAVICGPGK